MEAKPLFAQFRQDQLEKRGLRPGEQTTLEFADAPDGSRWSVIAMFFESLVERAGLGA